MADDPAPLAEEELDALLHRSGEALQANLTGLVDSGAALAQVRQEARRELQAMPSQIGDDGPTESVHGPARSIRHDAPGRARTSGSAAGQARYQQSARTLVEDFAEIEFQAARTGNHVRAAARMSKLAQEVDPVLRGEAHVRAGEQWMMADEPQPAADEFTAAIEDGGEVSAAARVHLARALFGLERDSEAELLLAGLTAERDTVSPRTCDLLAELFTEQGDLNRAHDWATVGVERCMQLYDEAELQLLLRLRYRLRVDLGLGEDDYDRMLSDSSDRQGRPIT